MHLNQLDKTYDEDWANLPLRALYKLCLDALYPKDKLKEMGFDRFREVLQRKATKNGLVTKETGVKKDDALLPFESQTMYEFINGQKCFQELDRLSKIVKSRGDSDSAALAEHIGSKATCDTEDLYSELFLVTRKYNLVKNDGKLVVPSEVQNTLTVLNQMLHLAYESDLPHNQRNRQFQELKKKLVNYKNRYYAFKTGTIPHNEDVAKDTVYFSLDSENTIRYAVKRDDIIHQDILHPFQLKGLSEKQRKALGSGDLRVLSQAKDSVLDVLSARGHTKKELTFWGKAEAIFSSIKASINEVLNERHDAPLIETVGNLYYNTVESVKLGRNNAIQKSEMLDKVVFACKKQIQDAYINSSKKDVQDKMGNSTFQFWKTGSPTRKNTVKASTPIEITFDV